ncbi:MAG: DUF393 domain-containing protein [Pseudomonadota bacterium]
MTTTSALSVYFDGSCPLCTREIAFYRRLTGAEAISWIDASQCPEWEIAPGLTKSAALSRFHVLTPGGELLSGASAFSRIWLELPRFRWLGALTQHAPISWLLERAYRGFLHVRPHVQRLAGHKPLCR